MSGMSNRFQSSSNGSLHRRSIHPRNTMPYPTNNQMMNSASPFPSGPSYTPNYYNGTCPSQTPAPSASSGQQPHDDLIKYICESWDKVVKEISGISPRNSGKISYYHERDTATVHPDLKDFQPFDLNKLFGNVSVTHNGLPYNKNVP